MDNLHKKWLWKKAGDACVNNLKRHQFDAHYLYSASDAVKLILDMSEPFESFGFGGSATISALEIKEHLKGKGKILYDHNEEDLPSDVSVEYRKKQSSADCFLCSANGISRTGEIVNVDGIGNRTNAMTFGPSKVIIVAGMNKVTTDLDSAIRRVKEVAAPMRAKSLGMETPCVESGICTDCNSPMRICRITTILHRKPMMTDISVVLVNEELGF